MCAHCAASSEPSNPSKTPPPGIGTQSYLDDKAVAGLMGPTPLATPLAVKEPVIKSSEFLLHWMSYLVQISHYALEEGTIITIYIYKQGSSGPEDRAFWLRLPCL